MPDLTVHHFTEVHESRQRMYHYFVCIKVPDPAECMHPGLRGAMTWNGNSHVEYISTLSMYQGGSLAQVGAWTY